MLEEDTLVLVPAQLVRALDVERVDGTRDVLTRTFAGCRALLFGCGSVGISVYGQGGALTGGAIEAIPQERCQAVAYIRRNVFFTELSPQGHRLAIAPEEAPAVSTVYDVCLEGPPLMRVESAVQVAHDKIHDVPTLDHAGQPPTLAEADFDLHKPHA